MFYAAYGSNLHPARLKDRVSSATLVGVAELDGWGLRFHKRGQDGSGKCGIVQTAEKLYVAVYDILPEEKPLLDAIENLGQGYDQMDIDLPSFGPCFLYVAQASFVDDTLKPFEWYKTLVWMGCQYHRFPADYVEKVYDVPHVQDSHVRRHEKWMGFIRRYVSS